MASSKDGPGVRRFWAARDRGQEADIAALGHEYPEEALDLARAARQAAAREDSLAREQMWLARAEILSRVGEDETLGTLLRRARNELGLTTAALSAALRTRGARIPPLALDRLEENRVTVTNVEEEIWPAMVRELGIEPHRVIAAIRLAIAEPRASQAFTRMDRATSVSDREKFLGGAGSTEPDMGSGAYLDRVRAALGLPSASRDAV